MSEPQTCASYVPGNGVGICRDGFIQKPICRVGSAVACTTCGRISERALPHCLSESLPNHWLKPDGSPLFYPPRQPDNSPT